MAYQSFIHALLLQSFIPHYEQPQSLLKNVMHLRTPFLFKSEYSVVGSGCFGLIVIAALMALCHSSATASGSYSPAIVYWIGSFAASTRPGWRPLKFPSQLYPQASSSTIRSTSSMCCDRRRCSSKVLSSAIVLGTCSVGCKIVEDIRLMIGHGIINADGDLWRTQRKAGLRFFSASNLQRFIDVSLPPLWQNIQCELDNAVDSHSIVDMQQVLHELTTRFMGQVAYDVRSFLLSL